MGLRSNIISLYTVYAVLVLFPAFADEHKSKESEKVYKEVKKLMEMMTLPRLGLYKLSGEGEYKSKDFTNASKEVIKYASKMKTIKHPDKAFQKTNEKMLELLAAFEAALKSGKEEQIKSKWHALNVSCNSCHALYNIK